MKNPAADNSNHDNNNNKNNNNNNNSVVKKVSKRSDEIRNVIRRELIGL